MSVDGLIGSRAFATSELLLLVGQHCQTQLSSELHELHAVRGLVDNSAELCHQSASALRLVADDRDAYAYYRVAEELGLDWGFSDPSVTLHLASWLGTLDDAICGGPQKSSRGALGCTCKALAEQSYRNLELEYEAAWLHSVFP